MATVPQVDRIPGLSSDTERRTEPRVLVNAPGRIKSLSPLMSTGPSIRTTIIELSHSGMRVRMNREFQLGELVQVIMPDTFYLGTIRHCRNVNGEFEAGIKLTERIPSGLV